MDRIRGALAADAPAIGALQAESWRHTYRGFLPDAYLDGDVFEDRDAAWRRRLATAHQHRRLTLVAEDGGALVGFAHAYVDDDAEWGTLLETLNVRPDRRRSGTGTRLMAVTAARLQRRGCTSGLYLWVAEWNRPAQRFYDALGGCVADRALADEGGGVGAVATLRYAWPRLDLLSSRIPTA